MTYLLGISYYAGAKHLTIEHYQILLDRGWRRSGTILYKPDLLHSCCAQYTVRLDSSRFQATKDQRQCINRLNKHLLGDSYIKDTARLYPLSREQAKKRDTEFNLVERVHEAETSHLQDAGKITDSLHPARKLEVTLESNEFTEEKYTIFENYQRIVHHEGPAKISKRGFTNFLCSSPLPTTQSPDGKRYGSFHQCYRIDGELVAIGVLDLLPHCVSGVYFLYHEAVHQHSFGKVGALREIAFAMEGGYQFWYPGFYIHK